MELMYATEEAIEWHEGKQGGAIVPKKVLPAKPLVINKRFSIFNAFRSRFLPSNPFDLMVRWARSIIFRKETDIKKIVKEQKMLAGLIKREYNVPLSLDEIGLFLTIVVSEQLEKEIAPTKNQPT
jgi:hypothetical protein